MESGPCTVAEQEGWGGRPVLPDRCSGRRDNHRDPCWAERTNNRGTGAVEKPAPGGGLTGWSRM